MGSQCEKCGKELPQAEEGADIRTSYHIVLGHQTICVDGDDDWEPDKEFDLCPECEKEFLQFWERWYGNE